MPYIFLRKYNSLERSVLEIISDRHKEWVYLVKCFGCDKHTAEDIVQDMYLKMHRVIASGLNIMYSDTEINSYYVLKTLKSIFIDYKRRNKITLVSIDQEDIFESVESDQQINFDTSYEKIQDELQSMYWFDRKVFDLVNQGQKISDLSRKTTIPYYTLYNTYKKVYNYLKQHI